MTIKSHNNKPLDPSNAPRPVKGLTLTDLGFGVLTTGSVISAVGAVLMLAGALPQRTVGATRSYHLNWQQQQSEIEQAIVGNQTDGASHELVQPEHVMKEVASD